MRQIAGGLQKWSVHFAPFAPGPPQYAQNMQSAQYAQFAKNKRSRNEKINKKLVFASMTKASDFLCLFAIRSIPKLLFRFLFRMRLGRSISFPWASRSFGERA